MSDKYFENIKKVRRFPVKFWTRHRVSHEWTTSAQVIYYLHIVPVAGNGKDVLNGGSYLGKTFQSLMWTLVEVNLFILNNHLSVFQTKKKSWLCCIITVFPHIVAAATILFWNLRCGNYSREETIQRRKLLISFCIDHR